jgi:hypothetical protein
MQDTDLFIHVAEIAGVFVGFGALIATRSGPMRELSDIRWVVTTGIWVVLAALLPIFASRYGVGGHELWLLCSILALALFAIMLGVNARAPEIKAVRAATFASVPLRQIVMVMGPTFLLPTALLVLALVLVVSDLLPDVEEAIYLTALGLGLFMGAMGLFTSVFWVVPAGSELGRPDRRHADDEAAFRR